MFHDVNTKYAPRCTTSFLRPMYVGQERLTKAGVKPGDREWELLLNEYDLRINRIFGVQ